MKSFLKIIAVSVLSFMSTLAYAEVSVIVNAANADSIDKKLVKRIYLGKVKNFPSGSKIKVISLGDSDAATEQFRQSALKKSNSQYKSYWSKIAFTGKGTPPSEVNSADEMIIEIKKNPNAIGFVDSSNVTSDVKVIATY